MKRIVNFLGNNTLLILSIFLLIFIPLYPKIPLLDIKNTWVNIRVEDFLIAAIFLIFGVMLLFKKATLKTPLTMPILVFWAVGMVSTIYAILFIFPTLTNVFPELAALHYLRRIEYLGVFFVGFSAIRGKKSLDIIIASLIAVTIATFIYGIGQKFWGFPAFLTGNEEFSKGIALRLGENARLTSTFAGHYDLSAYMVLVSPIFLAIIFGVKNWILRAVLFVTGLLGYLLILMTASRVSFGAILIAFSLLFVFIKQKKLIIPALIACLLLSTLFDGITERLGKTISQVDLVVDARTGKPVGIAGGKNGEVIVEDKTPEGAELKEGTGFINLPSDGIKRTATEIVYKRSRVGSGEDVTTIEGDFVVKSGFAYDVSFTTRFQGTWPRAIQAFDRNPLTGSGYSTINLASDNNFLRILGEVGILGFISFVGIFVIYGIYVRRITPLVTSGKVRMFSYGLTAGIVGLALNAVLIDAFEASKVAFSLWLLMGLNIGLLHMYQKKTKVTYLSDLKSLFTSGPAIVLYFIIGGFAIYRASTGNFFVADDFTWLRWAEYCKDFCAKSPQIMAEYFTKADGFFYRPGTKLYFYLMYNLFSLDMQKYHLVSILLHIASSYGVYMIARKILNSRWFGLVTGLIFLTLSIHFEAIFWVSVTGHLIAYALIIYSLVFYIYAQGKKRYLFLPLSLVAAFVAPLFYEIGFVTPLLIASYAALFDKEKFLSKKHLILIAYFAIIPLFLGLRYISQSHWSGGDYSYDLVMLPFNFVGNAGGYFAITLSGPDAIQAYTLLRGFLRENIYQAAGIILLIGIALAFMFYILRKHLKSENQKALLFALAFFVITLLPFLGFGNISPRYDYLASIGVILAVAVLIKALGMRFQKKSQRIYYILIIVCVSLFGIWNVYKLQILNNDWMRASDVTEGFIIYLYDQHPGDSFTMPRRTFYITPLPAKLGSAWLFPTGVEDLVHFALRNKNVTIVPQSAVTPELLQQLNTTKQLFIFDSEGNMTELNNEGLKIIYE